MSNSPASANYQALLADAFLEIKQMRDELDSIEQARREPIAIIGMGCRFPGGANSPEAFWELLANGFDSVTEVPKERWDIDEYYDPDPERPGKTYTRYGSFLRGIDQFDPAFFNISPREAAQMDPQQRLLLEVAWEAFEHAGQPVDRLAGSNTGVFVGICSADYQQLLMADPLALNGYSGTGSSYNIVSGRLSYLWDFQGPNMAIDTACSSSLVAAHLAVQSLRSGECDLALVAGVNLTLLPEGLVTLARMHAIAADGRCKTFDARADGFVRGEGCGAVVFKRLSDAQRDGDNILALIHGTASNQDGKSASLTAPNGLAQQAVIRQALSNAGVEPEQISYVEAHGTGTSLGDPIEVEALNATIGQAHGQGQSCALGSLKTNVGHMEAAAGIGSLIKVVLSMQHQAIPPNLHFQTLNPNITLDSTPFVIPTALRPWPASEQPRYAGVSSFGWSGTNAHIVIGDPASATDDEEESEDEGDETAAFDPAPELAAYMLPLSARRPEALRDLASRYIELLGKADTPLYDICATAARRRMHHDQRLAVVGASQAQLVERLEAFLRDEDRRDVVSGQASTVRQKVVFVFPGQGSQWLGMGRQLLASEPAFRAVIAQCDAAFRPFVTWSLLELLTSDAESEQLGQIDVIQPTLFAIEVALAALWRSWGIAPDAVIGHSMGEVAASYVAGSLPLDDAARVICRRSQLLRTVSGQGAMLLVELTVAQAEEALAGFEDQVAVAVSNSPRSTVLSGAVAALEHIQAQLQAQEVFCRWVKVDVASHSPQMDPLRDELLAALTDVRPQAGSTPIYSTVQAARSDGRDYDAAYWVRNLRAPVRFSDAVQQAVADGHTIFIEMSPHPILLPAVTNVLRHLSADGTVLPSLRRQEDELTVMLDSLGGLYAAGYPVDWARQYAEPAAHVALPRYPWAAQQFPPVAAIGPQVAGAAVRIAGPSGLPEGAYVEPASQPELAYWDTTISLASWPLLGEQRVRDLPALPGSGVVGLLLAAGRVPLTTPQTIVGLRFGQLLTFADDATWRVQATLTQTEDGRQCQFSVRPASGDEPWMEHASGLLRAAPPAPEGMPAPLAQLRERCTATLDGAALYEWIAARGLDYGTGMRSITQLWRGAGECLARLELPAQAAGAGGLALALIEGCFQVAALLPAETDGDELYMLSGIDELRLYGRGGAACWAYARLDGQTEQGGKQVTLLLTDEQEQPLLELRGGTLQSAARSLPPADARWQYQVAWREQPLPARAPKPAWATGSWLVFADNDSAGAALSEQLRANGGTSWLVAPGETYGNGLPGRYTVDPAQPEQFARLLSDLLGGGQQPCRGVLYMWGADAQHDASWPLAGLVGLIQALTSVGWRDAPRLWVVTGGAQPVCGAHDTAAAQAALWGLAQAAGSEHAELRPVCVDLSKAATESELAALLAALQDDGEEGRLVLRGTTRYVARLARPDAPLGRREPAALLPDASYLITGGLTPTGRALAGWAVEQGARHLALIDPRAPEAEDAAWLQSLAEAGVRVTPLALDLADADALRQALDGLGDALPPLRGVFHTDTACDDLLLARMRPAHAGADLARQLAGAWNLHSLASERAVDSFVLFSSSAALLGGPGSGAAAAVGSALAALAHARSAAGLPALCIDWAPWQHQGTEGGQSRGIASLEPTAALDSLGRLLGAAAPQIGLMPFKLRQWCQIRPEASDAPFFAELAAEPERDEAGSDAGSQAILAALVAAPAHERRQLLESYLTTQMALVLRMSPAQIEPTTPVRSLGVDSLMGMELRNRFEDGLGLTLPATLVWTYPTITVLAQHLADKLGLPLEEQAAPAPEEPAGDADAPIDDLSADDLAALLSEKLTLFEEIDE